MGIIGWLLSALGVGGLGLGALAFFMGPAALIPLAKGIFGFLVKIPWQIWVIGAAALVLAYFVSDRNKWKDRAEAYNVEAISDWTATKAASGNPKLARKDVAKQIAILGGDLKTSIANESTLRNQVAAQGASIQSLQETADAEDEAGVKAQNLAIAQHAARDAVIAQLDASKHSSVGKSGAAANCAPNDAVAKQWGSQ